LNLQKDKSAGPKQPRRSTKKNKGFAALLGTNTIQRWCPSISKVGYTKLAISSGKMQSPKSPPGKPAPATKEHVRRKTPSGLAAMIGNRLSISDLVMNLIQYHISFRQNAKSYPKP
jgi:hypothetical protein